MERRLFEMATVLEMYMQIKKEYVRIETKYHFLHTLQNRT